MKGTDYNILYSPFPFFIKQPIFQIQIMREWELQRSIVKLLMQTIFNHLQYYYLLRYLLHSPLYSIAMYHTNYDSVHCIAAKIQMMNQLTRPWCIELTLELLIEGGGKYLKRKYKFDSKKTIKDDIDMSQLIHMEIFGQLFDRFFALCPCQCWSV